MLNRWRRMWAKTLSLTAVFAPSGCFFFFLAFDARFFVMLSTARFSQDAILLNLAVETFERSFKRLVFADFDFRHQGSPPCGLFLRYTACISPMLHPSWTCGKIIVQALSRVKIFGRRENQSSRRIVQCKVEEYNIPRKMLGIVQ